MKKLFKIFVIALSFLLIVGCGKEETSKEIWPVDDIIKYNKGNIVAVTNEELKYQIKVNTTSLTDYNNYIDALKTTNFYYIDVFGDVEESNIWTGTNNTKYISVEYIDTYSDQYDGYNVNIVIYKNMPMEWKNGIDNTEPSNE